MTKYTEVQLKEDSDFGRRPVTFTAHAWNPSKRDTACELGWPIERYDNRKVAWNPSGVGRCQRCVSITG